MSNIFDSFTHMVLVQCPFCGKTNYVQLTADQWKRHEKWDHGRGGLIQNMLPDLSKDERELLKTGICVTCWDEMEKYEALSEEA